MVSPSFSFSNSCCSSAAASPHLETSWTNLLDSEVLLFLSLELLP